jgi:hypothetical protein
MRRSQRTERVSAKRPTRRAGVVMGYASGRSAGVGMQKSAGGMVFSLQWARHLAAG